MLHGPDRQECLLGKFIAESRILFEKCLQPVGGISRELERERSRVGNVEGVAGLSGDIPRSQCLADDPME